MTQPSGADFIAGLGAKVLGRTGLTQSPKPTLADAVTALAGPADPFTKKAGDLKSALAALQGEMPDSSAPAYQADPVQFAQDFQAWLSLYLDTSDAYAAQQSAAWGYATLPDGTMVPTGELTPQQAAIWQQANDAKYSQTMQALGLQQAKLVSDQRQAGFNNQMDRIDTAMKRDDTRLRRAESDINRSISGLSESRNRADLISSAKQAAAPYATQGGKTSFSGNDLGSLISSFAGFAGVDPNSSLLNYQGVSNIDPEGDMARLDAQLGVSGKLPGLPSLLSDEGSFAIPDVPDLGGIPQLSSPAKIDISSLLGGNDTKYNLNNPTINSFLSSLLGSGSGASSGRDTGLTREQRDVFGGSGPPAWQNPLALGIR
ncbi:MAG: hypothetical protein AB7I04_18535 [Pseudomonadales bacterium]